MTGCINIQCYCMEHKCLIFPAFWLNIVPVWLWSWYLHVNSKALSTLTVTSPRFVRYPLRSNHWKGNTFAKIWHINQDMCCQTGEEKKLCSLSWNPKMLQMLQPFCLRSCTNLWHVHDNEKLTVHMQIDNLRVVMKSRAFFFSLWNERCFRKLTAVLLIFLSF